MAKTKKRANKSESVKRIRRSFLPTENINTEQSAMSNVQTSQEIANVAVSIETLSEKQEDIFQQMLEVLKDIPESVREKEQQSDKLLEKIFDAIHELETTLEQESDPAKREKLQAGIGALKTQGQGLYNTSSFSRKSDRPTTLGESIASHYFGVDPSLKREHGFVKGFGKALVRDTRKAFGIAPREKKESFDEMLQRKMIISKSTSDISRISEKTREEKIAQRLASEPVATTEPKYTSDLAPDFASAADKFDELYGKKKPVASGSGKTKISKESAKNAKDYTVVSLKLLQQIADNTKKQLEMMKDTFGVDKNENLDQKRTTTAKAAVAPKFASSGSDYDDPNREVTKEEGGGEGEGGGILSSALSLAPLALMGGKGLFNIARTGAGKLWDKLKGKMNPLGGFKLNPFSSSTPGGPAVRGLPNMPAVSRVPSFLARGAATAAPLALASTALSDTPTEVPAATPGKPGLFSRLSNRFMPSLGGAPTAAAPASRGFLGGIAGKIKGKIPSGLTSRLTSKLPSGILSRVASFGANKGIGGMARAGLGRIAGKGLGKLGFKSVLKKIPLIGAVAGLGYGAARLLKGDWKGALGEVASGAVGAIPGIGTAASMGIDAAMAVRDSRRAEEAAAAPVEPEEAPLMESPVAQPTIENAEPAATMADMPRAKPGVIGSQPVIRTEAIERESNLASRPTTAPPVVNNITNNNVAPQGGGSQSSVSVVDIRDMHGSYMRFQERRLSRIL